MSLTRFLFASSNAASGHAARRLLTNPLLIGICIVFCSASRLRAAEDDRPHIAVIMADDLGFADLECRSETEDLVEVNPEQAEQMVRQWFKVAREADRLPKKLRRPAGDEPQSRPLERSRD